MLIQVDRIMERLSAYGVAQAEMQARGGAMPTAQDQMFIDAKSMVAELRRVQEMLYDINGRRENLTAWLGANHPEIAIDRKHLVSGSVERAYWQFGYLAALIGVLDALGANQQNISANVRELEEAV